MNSKSFKHLSDPGYTTYHEDGSRSSTYKNISDNGWTTYHSNGKTTHTYPNFFTGGFTSYTTDADPAAGAAGGGIFFASIAAGVLAVFLTGPAVILPLLLIAGAFAAETFLGRTFQTSIFGLWMHPLVLLGWRLTVDAVFAHTNHNFMELFGLVFIAIGIIVMTWVNSGDNAALFIYRFMLSLAMLVAKGFGDYAPYTLVGICFVVAAVVTIIWYVAKDTKNG